MKTFFIAACIATLSSSAFAGDDAKSGWEQYADSVKEQTPLGLGAMGMAGSPGFRGMTGYGEYPTASMGMTGEDAKECLPPNPVAEDNQD